MSERNTAYYLYGFTPSERLPAISAAGVDARHEVFVRSFAGLGAVLSEVPLQEFCGETAEGRLRDLAWLAPRACGHQAILEQVMRQSPVLPARFATLFASLDSLQKFVLEHRDTIAEFFSGLGDKREWAVKGLLNRTSARETLLSGPRGEPGVSTSPGTLYFREQRLRAEGNRKLAQWLRETCQGAALELREHAAGFRERKVWQQGEGDRDAEVILNWAFLLAPSAEADFQRCVERLNAARASHGLSVVLSGPWPAYSFAPALGESEPS